jgi:hypothetical protein
MFSHALIILCAGKGSQPYLFNLILQDRSRSMRNRSFVFGTWTAVLLVLCSVSAVSQTITSGGIHA